MPTRLPPPCRAPGCPELQVPGGRGYCEKHAREARKREDERRGSARERGYTKGYERAREWVLKRQPLCAVCRLEGRLTAAVVTHHVTPLSEGGTNSAANLLPVCEACHARLHSREGVALLERLKARTQEDGYPVG